MKIIGKQKLEMLAPRTGSKFGFHRFNSVDHIHLHCLAFPRKCNWLEYALKYCKPMLVSIDDVIIKLQEKRRKKLKQLYQV